MKRVKFDIRRFFSFVVCFLTAICWLGCKPSSPPASATRAVVFSAGDGSSIEKAVIVQASNENDGVAAEYKWLKEHYPGYARGNQSLMNSGGRAYDRLEITTSNGQPLSVFFDITSFFGK